MFSGLAPQHPTPVKSFNIILSVRIDQYRSTNFPWTEEHSSSLMKAPNIFAQHVGTESIECFIEGLAFSRSYDLVPRNATLHPPPPRQ
jgi:hypothetical protein